MALFTKPSAAPRAPLAATAARGRSRGRGAAAVLMAPFFLLFGLATLLPIGYAVWLSLFQEHHSGLGFGAATTVFSGLSNYGTALADPVFRSGFLHVAVFALVYVPLMLAGSLLVSLLLDSALARAKRFLQLALFLPHVVPGIIAAIIWLYLYTPGVSPVVSALQSGGIGFNLDTPFTAIPATANVAVWEVLGYNIVIFYAALQAIPRELLEAAVIDGASELRISLSVKLPLVRSSVGLVGLFTGIGVLQLFQEPLLLNRAAPGVITTFWTPNMYDYAQAFNNSDYGLSAAGSILLALVCAGLSFLVTRISNPWRSS
ncbi:carbohydrate ABC transporter permease [Streptacidiphilus sp. N1-3]|uniref:Carbohydrate ABC transporter permease n=1 Tax=Streptacidiphilus alkalitolerans TaxID=3342712 RepID=A0ABV6WWR2_9ACTN